MHLMHRDLENLIKALESRDKKAVSWCLNLAEDKRDSAQKKLGAILEKLKQKAHRIGITGPPGVGKSTLACSLATSMRKQNQSVGVIAVDPSSINSGGSLLGDRTRISSKAQSDPDLFIRSMATHGHSGGLNIACYQTAHILGAIYDIIIIETTGVGQNEADIRHIADTILLVIQPGSGDALQFIKAGIMEIPDIFVINKVDHPTSSDHTMHDLKHALHACDHESSIPVIKASATHNIGIKSIIQSIEHHQKKTASKRALKRRKGTIAWIYQLFLTLHGTYGIQSLGGHTSLIQKIEKELDHAPPSIVCKKLSELYIHNTKEQPS